MCQFDTTNVKNMHPHRDSMSCSLCIHSIVVHVFATRVSFFWPTWHNFRDTELKFCTFWLIRYP